MKTLSYPSGNMRLSLVSNVLTTDRYDISIHIRSERGQRNWWAENHVRY